MYVEIPQIQRCCCCVPARHGLLVWTYIRLLISIIVLCPMVIFLVIFPHLDPWSISIDSVAILMLSIDVVINIVTVLGAHMKKLKLLKFYYKYYIYSLVMFSIAYTAIFALNLYTMGFFDAYHPYVWSYVIWYVLLGFAAFGIQVYMLLILRTIVHKLESQSKFRFMNHGAEAEAKCTMDINSEFIWNSLDEHRQRSKDDGRFEVNDATKNNSKIINKSNEDSRQNESFKETDGSEEIKRLLN